MNKPFLIFSSLLFISIVTGTIITGRELADTKVDASQATPVSMAGTMEPTATPGATVTPSPVESESPTLPFLEKPSVNVRVDDDDEEEDDD